MTLPLEIRVLEGRLDPQLPVFSPAAGAVLDFYGVVRDQEKAGYISGIAYEAHAVMARHQLALLAKEAAGRFPILELIIHHRIGFVPVAEPSLFLRVSAAHRGAAFAAGQWLIEELKAKVPIWKQPVFISATSNEAEEPGSAAQPKA